MDRISINHLINMSVTLQVVRDYVNRHWYFTAKARVVSQRHLSINLDLPHPVVCLNDVYKAYPCWQCDT